MRKIKSTKYNNPKWNVDTYDYLRYFIELNGQFPFLSRIDARSKISVDLLNKKLIEAGATLEWSFQNPLYGPVERFYKLSDDVFIIMNPITLRDAADWEDLSDVVLDNKNNKGQIAIVNLLTILHTTPTIDQVLIDSILECSLKEVQNAHVSIISRDNQGYFLSSVDLDSDYNDNLELHYGEGFTTFHETLVNKLINSKKGITLFHGDPGTGKSSYIRRLIKDLIGKTTKKIIFIPNNMISFLLDPDFTSFLLDAMEEYTLEDDQIKGFILVIEDGDVVLKNREDQIIDAGTSNMLNLTDGLMNDVFGVQIIATFNSSINDVDPAFLRSQRLICKKKFKQLTKDNAQKLIDFLKIEHTATESMAIANIYGLQTADVDKILIEDDEDERSKIGFLD